MTLEERIKLMQNGVGHAPFKGRKSESMRSLSKFVSDLIDNVLGDHGGFQGIYEYPRYPIPGYRSVFTPLVDRVTGWVSEHPENYKIGLQMVRTETLMDTNPSELDAMIEIVELINLLGYEEKIQGLWSWYMREYE